jgi:hypothetical protein
MPKPAIWGLLLNRGRGFAETEKLKKPTFPLFHDFFTTFSQPFETFCDGFFGALRVLIALKEGDITQNKLLK